MSEKPYHLLPSRTQRQLYKALFRIRLAGYRHMHKAEARASDGLSNKERLALIGVVPDGAHVSSGVHSAGRIPGVSIRTYQALAHRGYVMCRHGYWFALFKGEPRVAMLATSGRLE
jgi:hypothetical protein